MMATGIASIDALDEAFGELRRALETHDASRINAATKKLSAVLDSVKSQGAWRMEPALRDKLDALLPAIESARVHVNLASDDVRQRIGMLADRGANKAASLTYRR